MEVVLYTKPGCCLCDKVKSQLGKLREVHPFELREINILDDAAAFARFEEEIPVVFVRGRKVFKYRLDEKAFLRQLRSRSALGEDLENGS